jgi:hypothetical protein
MHAPLRVVVIKPSKYLKDGVRDYISLRKGAFGFELAPLPRSLQAPATSNPQGRGVKPKLPPVSLRRADPVLSQ